MNSLGHLRLFLDDLWVRFKSHTEDESAHHIKYADAEVDAIVATHTTIASAHHTKTIDASELSMGEIADARIPAGVARDTEVIADIANHAALASVHHTKYSDTDAVTAMGVKGNSNPLHHDKFIPDALGIRRNAIYSAPNGWSWLDWTASANADYDHGGLFDTSASTRITIQRKGIYLLTFMGFFSASAAGAWRVLRLCLNGVAIYDFANNATVNATNHVMLRPSQQLELDVGDYLEYELYQDSGGNLNFDAYSLYHGCKIILLRET